MEIKEISVIKVVDDIITIEVEIDNWFEHSIERIRKELQNMFDYPERFSMDSKDDYLRVIVFECDVKLKRRNRND